MRLIFKVCRLRLAVYAVKVLLVVRRSFSTSQIARDVVVASEFILKLYINAENVLYFLRHMSSIVLFVKSWITQKHALTHMPCHSRLYVDANSKLSV